MSLRSVGKQYRLWLAAPVAAVMAMPAVALADKKDEPRGPLFDPEALERGAAALREINKSSHAKQARPCSGPPVHGTMLGAPSA